jgi:hypothetical protein
MSKDPYKIVNSKPSWASKLATGGVALGSVATAIVITVPGLPGYETLSQAFGSGAQQEVTNSSGLGQGSQSDSTSPSEVSGQNSTGSSTVARDPKLSTSTKTLSSATLTLPGISSGNTSSPTPYSTVSSSTGVGGQASGNVSSPTPSGSTSGYEADEYEEEDEYEEDEAEYEEEEEEEEEEDD